MIQINNQALMHAYNIQESEVLAGETSLSFSIRKADAPEALSLESMLVLGDKHYLVRNITERKNSGGYILDVYAVPSWYDLARFKIEAKTFKDASAIEVFRYALKGTGWKVTSNVSPRRSFDVVENNALELIQTVRELYGGFLLFNTAKKTMSHLSSISRDQGLFFTFDKNLLSVEKEVDSSNIATKLYVYGKDNLTFASINGGKNYLEDYSYFDKVIAKTLSLESFTSQAELLNYARMRLGTLSKPKVSYRLTVADLSRITGYTHEAIALGDTVRVYDKEMDLDLKTQVVRIEKDFSKPENTKVELSSRTKGLSNRDLVHEREQAVKERDNEDRLRALRTENEKAKTELKAWRDAQTDLSSLMAKGQGYYTTIKTDAFGAITSYVHDKPELEDSTLIFKKNAEGESYSNDGGKSWNSGRDADGNLLAKTISTIGLKAEWITVGDDPLSDVLRSLGKDPNATDVFSSRTAPTSPKPGILWLDTSKTPAELKVYESGRFNTLKTLPRSSSVGSTELKSSSVSSDKIQANAITSTKITPGAITTDKLSARAVTADKIQANAITSEKIAARSITADKLSVLAKNLVNNFSATGIKDGWHNNIVLQKAPEKDNSWFYLAESKKSLYFKSDKFDIDPRQSYRFSISVRSPYKDVGIFFGFVCYDKDGNTLEVTEANGSAKTKSPYFYGSTSQLPNWTDYEGYVFGQSGSLGIKGKNVSRNFRWPQNAQQACVICWQTRPKEDLEDTVQSYWWGPSVVCVDSGIIEAERMTTGLLQSKNKNSWLNLDDGTFSFARGALSYSGSGLAIKGNISSTESGRTAHLNNGQLTITNGSQEILNISNIVAPGRDAHIILGSGSNRLAISKSATKGSVTGEFMSFHSLGSNLKIKLNAPIELPTSYKLGKIEIYDFGDGGIGLMVNGSGVVLNAGKNGVRAIRRGIVVDL